MLLPLLLLLSLSLVIQGKNATRHVNNKKTHTLPIVITTWSADGFQQANENGFNALPGGRLHALVEGLSTCERLQCDTTVGFGGSPDESGETTLDAMLIDGPGHRLASVAQLHRVKDAARVAWAVMNYTRHTMLVGEAATQFALSIGFKESSLASNVSHSMMDEWKRNSCQPNFRMNVSPDARTSCGPYKPLKMVKERVDRAAIVDRFHHDTIGMVVIDKDGEVSAGTSTNGARYKIPGRVGDSPIPGAGAYLMKGVGGAAATGDGDVMMRFLTSFTAVEWMRQGVPPSKAARKALTRILEFYPDFQGAVVAASVHGDVGAACAGLKSFGYSVRTGVDVKTRVETVQCIH